MALLGTYLTAAATIVAAATIGQGILALCGWHRASPLAPAVGLAAMLIAAWAVVRLPGAGWSVAATIAVGSFLGAVITRRRIEGVGGAVRAAAPSVALVGGLASLPFVAAGHVGILGTGFNVDMSQHLFATDWLVRPLSGTPDLIAQGYPMGPHALAAGLSKLAAGNLVSAFSGLTLAAPTITAITAGAALRTLRPVLRAIASAVAALPYLSASYLAQGSFKELILGCLIVAFVLVLAALVDGEPEDPERSPHPYAPMFLLALLGAASVYVYSAPGLVWLIGAAAGFAVLELALRIRRGRELRHFSRNLVAPTLAVVALTVAMVVPELGRILEFRGNVSSVAGGELVERSGGAVAMAAAGSSDHLDFNDNLGNLFGDISPLEVGGVWPSGDFRVQPGDGSLPAPLFIVAAVFALGAVGLGSLWVVRAATAGQRALVPALAAACLIALVGLLGSTPYTTAKLLMLASPLAALVAARGLLGGAGPGLLRLVGAVWISAAAASSVLALANAPVGPEDYSTGLAKLREKVQRRSTLVLAKPGLLADHHGREFLAWELRGARPLCVEPDDGEIASAAAAPGGIRWVITTGGVEVAPYRTFAEYEKRGKVTLWQGPKQSTQPPGVDPTNPTACALAPG